MKVEIACANFESVQNAHSAGADRIELCAALEVGGISPSFGLIRKSIEIFQKNVFVLIRPREGDFVYSDDELEIMLSDIHLAREMGAGGIVSGALLQNNKIDIEKTQLLIEASGNLPFTFHRAFDLVPDPISGLLLLEQLGVKRILTSGQKENALAGKELLKTLNERATSISILAGAGINPLNVCEIVSYTKVSEVHLSAKHKTGNSSLVSMGNSDSGLYDVSDERTIRLVISELNKLL
ncbi:MAG: copper homeostasis protein CutC [Bacteroidia bacterium]|nr:copper homeostasis protein CutC [Bacteroidota bacterium]MBP6427999.1 copper homeostasis protein CutC [Bacteroidia bacterium]